MKLRGLVCGACLVGGAWVVMGATQMHASRIEALGKARAAFGEKYRAGSKRYLRYEKWMCNSDLTYAAAEMLFPVGAADRRY